jgi:acyl-homoserine-lactone acylase
MPTAAIYRDEFGVPHIHAESEASALYAHGYAQAQDRAAALLENLRMAKGELAAVYGASKLEEDMQKRLLRIAETSQERYHTLEPQVRCLVEAFTDGVNCWLAEHPASLPEWAAPIIPQDVVALNYWLVQSWCLGLATMKLAMHRTAASEHSQMTSPHNSNEWAVSPEHSAESCAILLIDPHVPWEGMYRWYEAHIHAGNLHAAGFTITGLPFILLGFTDHVSWAATAGGADSCDLVEEQLDEPGGKRYRYGDAWLNVEETTTQVQVREGDQLRSVGRVLRRTQHGPVLAEEGDRAYVMHSAFEGQIGTVEQSYAMNQMRSMADFKLAMNRKLFVSQNMMAADTAGDIYYVQYGRCPERAAGYDCLKPIPGWLREAEWGEPVDINRMPHIENPPYSHWMQNCNVTPFHTTPEHAIDHRAYPKELLMAHVGDVYRPRGFRVSSLLHRQGIIGHEEARRIAMDCYVMAAEPWIAALQRAEAQYGHERPENSAVRAQALNLLAAWDGYSRKESIGPAVFKYWRLEYARLHPEINAENEHLSLPRKTEELRDALVALERGCQALLKAFGRLDIEWGEVKRVRRGEHSLPLSGDAFSNLGFRTLRATEGLDPEADGRFYGAAGNSCTTIVLMKNPPEAWSITPWGQCDDPASTHYFDQAMLFSNEQFKPMWFGYEPDLAHMRLVDTLQYNG